MGNDRGTSILRFEQNHLHIAYDALDKTGFAIVQVIAPHAHEALVVPLRTYFVERDGEAVAVLTPGAIVGEQAVLLNLPRNASVTAGTDVRVAAMNRREFSTALDQCPQIARTILNSALERAGAGLN